jgi:hypothetical protein
VDDDTAEVEAVPRTGAGPVGSRRRRRQADEPGGIAAEPVAPTAFTPARRRKLRAGDGTEPEVALPDALAGPHDAADEQPATTTNRPVGEGGPGPDRTDATASGPGVSWAGRLGLSRLGVRPVAAAVAVVLGLGVGGVLAVDDDAGPRLADYAAGRGGEVLVAADGGFRAQFPAAPARRTQSVEVDGASVPVVDYTGKTGGQTFTVSYAQLPEGQEVGDPILRLNASATAAAEAVKGKLEAAGITSFLGQPAVEYLIAVNGRYVKATSFLAGRRIYGIEVVGPANPPAGYERFKETFELSG